MIDNADQGRNRYVVSTDIYIAEEKKTRRRKRKQIAKPPITAEEWKKRCASIRINGLAMGSRCLHLLRSRSYACATPNREFSDLLRIDCSALSTSAHSTHHQQKGLLVKTKARIPNQKYFGNPLHILSLSSSLRPPERCYYITGLPPDPPSVCPGRTGRIESARSNRRTSKPCSRNSIMLKKWLSVSLTSSVLSYGRSFPLPFLSE